MQRLSLAFVLLLCFFANQSFNPGVNRPTSEKEVDLRITLKVKITGHIKALRLKMMMPASIKDRQTIDEQTWSIEPDSVYKANGNTYALFKMYDLEDDFTIDVKSRIIIYNSISMKADTSNTGFSKYLVAEPNIEVESSSILSVAKELEQKTDIETIIKTFDYVKNHITYKRNAAIGAAKVLQTGVGKCMDYSDLFVALLRANRIPAKSIFGIVLSESSRDALHAWPEAYLKKQGWIRFDPTTGHSEIQRDGFNYKMRISNKYVTLSEGRNDPELRTSLVHCNYKSTTGSSLELKTSFDIRER